MSNVTAVTSHFRTANEGFATSLNGNIAAGAAIVPLTSVAGLTNNTVFVGIIEPGATKQQVFTGLVDTANSQITGVVWTTGTNVPHTGGVSIVDYVTGTGENMRTKGMLVAHNQDGTHKPFTETSIVPTGAIQDHAITFVKLALTIFSGQITAGTNSGTAGGTMNTINLGGLKLAWGRTAGYSAPATTVVALTVVYPASFFGSRPVEKVEVADLTLTPRQNGYVQGGSGSAAGFTAAVFNSDSTAAAGVFNWWAIGT